jgi:putative ABC transport system permease protein
MHVLLQDLRYAARSLLLNRGFTAAAVLTLALGLGANAAIFSAVSAVLLQPLPYKDAQRLFVIFEQHPDPVGRTRLSAENFLDVQREARLFDAIGGYTGTGFTLTGRGEAELVLGQLVSAELMQALGVHPQVGRTFRPDENEGGRDQVVLLSHGLWQRRFGGDRAIVGQTITANGKPYAVIGVMPRDFHFPEKRYELWAPFAFRNNASGLVNRRARFMRAAGRIKADVSVESAGAELATIGRRLAETYPADNTDVTLRMASVVDETVGDVRRPLVLLLCAVGFVVLIACANVTNLLLARATARQREVAVRTALGATRGRLVRQFLTETLLLYALGAALALLFAAWAVGGLVAMSPPDIPRLDAASIDVQTIVVTFVIAFLTALVFGLAPALQSTRHEAAEYLKAAQRTATPGRSGHRLRSALVIAEVALSLMLLIGASLVVRSMVALQRVDTGIAVEGAFTFAVLPREARYPSGDAVRRFHAEFLEQLSARGGALAVGGTTHLPLSGQNVENSFTPDGWTPPVPNEQALAGLRGVAGRYFDAIGARIVAGRPFSGADRQGAAPVVMVNQLLAQRYWPTQDAVGKRLKLGGASSQDPWRTVVGVYADVTHMGPAAQLRPEISLPYAQLDDEWVTRWMRGLSVVARSPGDPARIVRPARQIMREIDPDIPLVEPQPMTAMLAASIAEPRFRGVLFGTFAALALLLALIGVYGVLAYLTKQRTHELSVRLALGAQPASLVRLVVVQGLRPVAAGIAIGVVGAFFVSRAMEALLFRVGTNDALSFIVMPAIMVVVTVAACLIPARRALTIDPAEALRSE